MHPHMSMRPCERKFAADTPLGRVGQPSDIATVVSFFASDDAKWITGETVVASGGHRG